MENIKSEASRTGDEFRDLRNAQIPSTTTVTGQPLTRMEQDILLHRVLG